MEFRYFSPVAGRAVARPGTRSFVATRRGPDGFEWDEDEIVRIPLDETITYSREYATALRDQSLRERTSVEYDAWTVKAERATHAPVADLPEPPAIEVAAASVDESPKPLAKQGGGKR